MGGVKGIIFDMDNTLLSSRIDYARMKTATHRYLVSRGVLPEDLDVNTHSTGTLIAEAMESGKMTDEWIREMWALVASLEVEGMREAELEPGVPELLESLHGRILLSVVTNNSMAAAREALMRNGIWPLFDCVVAREQMARLKPSPDGFQVVMARYPDFKEEEWLAVGDSWIDGQAAAGAGIGFLAYRSDPGVLRDKGVHPLAVLTDIRELASWLQGRGSQTSGTDPR